MYPILSEVSSCESLTDGAFTKPEVSVDQSPQGSFTYEASILGLTCVFLRYCIRLLSALLLSTSGFHSCGSRWSAIANRSLKRIWGTPRPGWILLSSASVLPTAAVSSFRFHATSWWCSTVPHVSGTYGPSWNCYGSSKWDRWKRDWSWQRGRKQWEHRWRRKSSVTNDGGADDSASQRCRGDPSVQWKVRGEQRRKI